MPRNASKPKKKLKTHRGAAKRFKVTAGGKILRMHSGKRHLLGTKAPGRMRKLKKLTLVNKADNNLEDVFKQTPSDELKAEAAIDQYANARDNLTRTLTKMSLQMRNVLTADQWQELEDRQAGRAGLRPGRGGGRRGTSPSGSAPTGSAANKVPPAVSQK